MTNTTADTTAPKDDVANTTADTGVVDSKTTSEGVKPDAATEGTKPELDAEGKPKQDNVEGDKGDKGDTKPEGDKPEGDKPAGAPEGKYELKLPEGVEISADVQEQFETVARELNLSPDAAQKMLDLAPQFDKMYASKLLKTANDATDRWAEQSRNDKELSNGGDKAALDANLALAAKARDAFASPELVALLNKFDPETNPHGTGLGNHPEVLRLFTRLGKSISEDNKLVTGGVPKEEQTAAQKLYANTKK